MTQRTLRLLDRVRHLDLRLRVSSDFSVRVIEQPGLWMTSAETDELVATLRDITERSIGNDLEYGILSGDPERLRNGIVTLVYDSRTDRPMAFNALSYMDLNLRGREQRALHLGLVVVDPAFRARGMSWVLYGLTCILIFFRRGLRPLWISNVTQVPAIIGKVAEVFVTAYPNPFHESRRTFDHLSVARQIMQRHRHVFGVGAEAGFDEQRFVITNAYTGGSDHLKKTFAEAPKHRDERANALCEKELDYSRGDDFLQIARLDLPSARRYLTREVPRNSLPSLLWQLLFVLVGRMVLPLVHWLSPSVDFGNLRARDHD